MGCQPTPSPRFASRPYSTARAALNAAPILAAAGTGRPSAGAKWPRTAMRPGPHGSRGESWVPAGGEVVGSNSQYTSLALPRLGGFLTTKKS